MIMIRIMIKIQNERKKKCWLRIFLVCSPCSPKPVSLRKRVCSPYQPCWRRPSCPAAPAQLQCGHGKLHAEGRCTHPATSTQPPPPTNLTNPRPPRPSSHTTIRVSLHCIRANRIDQTIMFSKSLSSPFSWLGAYMPLRPVKCHYFSMHCLAFKEYIQNQQPIRIHTKPRI